MHWGLGVSHSWRVLVLSGELSSDRKLSGDVRQALEDLSEIARIEADGDDESLKKRSPTSVNT